MRYSFYLPSSVMCLILGSTTLSPCLTAFILFFPLTKRPSTVTRRELIYEIDDETHTAKRAEEGKGASKGDRCSKRMNINNLLCLDCGCSDELRDERARFDSAEKRLNHVITLTGTGFLARPCRSRASRNEERSSPYGRVFFFFWPKKKVGILK